MQNADKQIHKPQQTRNQRYETIKNLHTAVARHCHTDTYIL
ncbi:unknown [Prevotella sp. CAG:873]|nr:unknown [Prevotella sp. CAG:873]